MSLTPEQFNKLATRQDLNELEERLEDKFVTKEHFDQKMDALFELIDGIATSHKKFDEELVANIGAHDRIEENIQKIDIRVKKLEAASI